MEQQVSAQGQTVQLPTRRKLPTLVAIMLLFAAGLFVGRYLIPAGELQYSRLRFVSIENGERQLTFPTFWEAWDILHNSFIGELKDEDLFYGSIAGMVRAAGDPYTVFAPPADTKQFEETIEGSFSGIGIEIGIRGGIVTVIAPLEGSPARKAGILEGDAIAAVDDEPLTQETTLDQVIRKIRGEKGKAVKLTVVHKGENKTEDLLIIRDTITVESVRMKVEEGVAHIKITNFNGDTASRFTAAARETLQAGVRGIILDLRGNPGGFLQAAVDISSLMLEKEKLVVSERGKQKKDYFADGNAILKDIPIVILVNEGSASASEIVAGALQDQRNTPIIGTKTFGKGSVQEFVKLSDHSSLRVTIAKWFTPSGRSIDEQGIEPTVIAEDNRDTEEDEQLLRAREELSKLIQ